MPDVYVASGEAAKEDKPKVKDYSRVMQNFRSSMSPLGALLTEPKNYRVEVQQRDEKILLLARRHPITNAGWILTVGLMLVSSLGFQFLPFWSLLPERFQLMTYILWYLLTTAMVMGGFLRWYFDAFVITDERIIDIDFNNLVHKNITTTKIDNIEDVTYNVTGAIQSLFNFGQVLIQTAGPGLRMEPDDTIPAMEIWDTPQPAEVAKLIDEMILEEEQEKLEGRVR